MIVKIIDQHKGHNVRFFICVDSIGKEEIVLFLAEYY